MFDRLGPAQKAAFTKQWNIEHKDPTKGVRGKKGKKEEVPSEEDDYMMMDEDFVAEIKNAKRK